MSRLLAGGLALLLSAPAAAADPWGRPGHLRAVQQPPSSWADLDRPRLPVRLWWDRACRDGQGGWSAWTGEHCALAEVQQERGGRWVTVARDLAPGWTSRPVARGTGFRVRLWRAGEPSRWSSVVRAPTWASPSDLARLGAVPGAQLASRTGQVRGDHRQGIWASTLGGGAVALDPIDLDGQVWTRWQGLPEDRVIDLALDGERVLLGTAQGALLLDAVGPVRSWAEELPSSWVQAVALEDGRAWLGTDAGLALVQPGAEAQLVLQPQAVFSLAPAQGGGVWAGYDGIARVDTVGQATHGSALAGAHVYDLEQGRGQLWAASEEHGLSVMSPQRLDQADSDGRPAAYGLALDPEDAGGAWVARGPRGLQWTRGTWLGRDEGLPSDSVWAVEALGDRLWLGTQAGVAALVPEEAGRAGYRVLVAPQAPWPAERAAAALLVDHGGAWIAGEQGMTRLGRPGPHADDLVVAAPHPVVALLEDDGRGHWAVGSAAVRLDRHGDLHRVELPEPAADAAWWQGALWTVSGDRLWRVDPDSGAARTWLRLAGLERLAAGSQALWGIAGGRVMRLDPGQPRPIAALRLAHDLSPDPSQEHGVLWVGTVSGLERLVTSGPREGSVDDPLGELDHGWEVLAVGADGEGGCWLATADGRVGHLRGDGAFASTSLAQVEPPRARRIVVDSGGDAAWVLTDAGTWRVQLAR